jgi:hypothetical protein
MHLSVKNCFMGAAELEAIIEKCKGLVAFFKR